MTAATRAFVILAAGCAAFWPCIASAEDATSPKGILDSVLEKLDFKAKPADPAPDFVVKTRPDASRLDYMERSVPHKVSPIPVKTPDEVQAAKDALDAARDRQLNPVSPPTPLQKPKPAQARKAAAAKPPN